MALACIRQVDGVIRAETLSHDEATLMMQRLADRHVVTLKFADDEAIRVNGLDAYLNRSLSAGADYIEIGIYDDNELRMLSFFHELGHCLDPCRLHKTEFAQEQAAWDVGYQLAAFEGVEFSENARMWALANLETYDTPEYR